WPSMFPSNRIVEPCRHLLPRSCPATSSSLLGSGSPLRTCTRLTPGRCCAGPHTRERPIHRFGGSNVRPSIFVLHCQYKRWKTDIGWASITPFHAVCRSLHYYGRCLVSAAI